MLKLASSREPLWLDLLPGVRVQFRPISPAAMIVARSAVGKIFQAEDQADVEAVASVALVRELAQRGIVGWEGVGDADGQPVAVNSETIDALLDHWPAFDAIDRQYIVPALALDAEKNGSSPSPNGTSGAEPDTAQPAPAPAPNALIVSTN